MKQNEKIYVVTGATGNIGKRVAETLLAEGQKVRVIARDRAKLEALAKLGAEVHVGSLDDTKFLAKAFAGTKAIFAMIPPNYAAADQRAAMNVVGKAIAEAVREAKVSHVVSLSSIGANLPDKTGPVKGLYDQEQRFNALGGVNVLHLRPAFFMENLFHQVPLVQTGITGGTMRGDTRIPMIATEDIAAEAARRLLALDFDGKQIAELLGERDLTMHEVTEVLAKATGKPALKYVEFPFEAAEQSMVQSGMSRDVARNMNELNRAANDGLLAPVQGRSKRTTTPTSIEKFVEGFARAFS